MSHRHQQKSQSLLLVGLYCAQKSTKFQRKNYRKFVNHIASQTLQSNCWSEFISCIALTCIGAVFLFISFVSSEICFIFDMSSACMSNWWLLNPLGRVHHHTTMLRCSEWKKRQQQQKELQTHLNLSRQQPAMTIQQRSIRSFHMQPKNLRKYCSRRCLLLNDIAR